MNEREKTREGNTGTRGELRALGLAALRALRREGGGPPLEAGQPRGARPPPWPRRQRGVLLPLSRPGPSVGNFPGRILAPPPALYTWTLQSPPGCPPQRKPNQCWRRAGPSAALTCTPTGRPLKTPALPAPIPRLAPGADHQDQCPRSRAAVAGPRLWGVVGMRGARGLGARPAACILMSALMNNLARRRLEYGPGLVPSGLASVPGPSRCLTLRSRLELDQ